MSTPTVYHSRSRTNRKRIIVVAAVLILVLVGFLIGKLQGGSPAAGSAPPSAPPSSSAAAPSPSDPPPPTTAPPAPAGVDAYAPIQAEGAAALTGVDKEDTGDQGGGQDVGWICKGDSMRFDTIDFGGTPATSFEARLASAVGDGVNGRVEIHVDSADSPPVGTLPISGTGGWQNWTTQATDITGVTGVHTVFLTFNADRGDDFLNLNYVKFGRASS
jgi:Carbohydrate binding module (family 6)